MEVLKTMDLVMPLELWGIALGVIMGMFLRIGFLSFMDWIDRR